MEAHVRAKHRPEEAGLCGPNEKENGQLLAIGRYLVRYLVISEEKGLPLYRLERRTRRVYDHRFHRAHSGGDGNSGAEGDGEVEL